MGNWRTVHLIGSCHSSDLPALREACRLREDFHGFHALTDAAGIMGLNDWPAEMIDRQGNLAERDYSVADVAQAARQLLELAPSLTLKIHCGGEEESRGVVATITVQGREVTTGPPEILRLPERSNEEMERGVIYALQQARRYNL